MIETVTGRPTANVYVDGFNLYNRALRFSPHKWLDLEKMAQRLLRRYDINRVRYFTARIKARPDDLQAPSRQNAYLRALETNPKVSVHLGQFLLTKPYMAIHPLTLDADGHAATVQVRKTEEKGSDVNIATYMMFDAFRDDADVFVLVSNDSDLAETVRLMSVEMKRTVGIIFPVKNPSNQLLKSGPAFVRHIRNGTLAASQLPVSLTDAVGTIHKPKSW